MGSPPSLQRRFIIFPPGTTRHNDWLLHYGDHLVYESRVGAHPEMAYDEGDS